MQIKKTLIILPGDPGLFSITLVGVNARLVVLRRNNAKIMKMKFYGFLGMGFLLCMAGVTSAQDHPDKSKGRDYDRYPIQTLFGGPRIRASGGYAALTNKFSSINGEFANLVEIYGGWYINHRFLLGVSGAAVTNTLPVPNEFSVRPGERMSYAYGQAGLMTEFVIGSQRVVHLSVQLFNGAGFTVQYLRDLQNEAWDEDFPHDTNWFYVAEPGVKLEVNVFRWLRLCPGISYRAAFNSRAKGLSDSDLSGSNINLTLKIGKF